MLIRNRTTDKRRTTITAERQTVELCADAREGRYCILPRGHHGEHESPTPLAVHTWK